MDASNGRTPPPYAELFERYRDGRPWHAFDQAAGINTKTREQWLSGYTRSPPLAGVLRLAEALGVPAQEVADAVRGAPTPTPTVTLATLHERLVVLEDELKLRPSRDEVRQLVEGDFAREVRADAVRYLAERAAALGHEAQDRPAGEGGSGTQQ